MLRLLMPIGSKQCRRWDLQIKSNPLKDHQKQHTSLKREEKKKAKKAKKANKANKEKKDNIKTDR